MASHEVQDPSRPVSERIVEAVADETGTDPADLEPLYYSVDPESLDALYGDGTVCADRNGCRVRFRHAGQRITVAPEGSVTVAAVSGAETPEDDASSSHPGGQPEAPD